MWLTSGGVTSSTTLQFSHQRYGRRQRRRSLAGLFICHHPGSARLSSPSFEASRWMSSVRLPCSLLTPTRSPSVISSTLSSLHSLLSHSPSGSRMWRTFFIFHPRQLAFLLTSFCSSVTPCPMSYYFSTIQKVSEPDVIAVSMYSGSVRSRSLHLHLFFCVSHTCIAAFSSLALFVLNVNFPLFMSCV